MFKEIGLVVRSDDLGEDIGKKLNIELRRFVKQNKVIIYKKMLIMFRRTSSSLI